MVILLKYRSDILTLWNTRFKWLIPALKRRLIMSQLLWALFYSIEKKTKKKCLSILNQNFGSYYKLLSPRIVFLRRGKLYWSRNYLWIFSLRIDLEESRISKIMLLKESYRRKLLAVVFVAIWSRAWGNKGVSC